MGEISFHTKLSPVSNWMEAPMERLAGVFGTLPLLVFTVACSQIRYTEAVSVDEPIQRIEIYNDAGVVDIAIGEALSVERTVRAPDGTVELGSEVAGGVLELRGECTTVMPCAVDLRVVVPRGVSVRVVADQGEVWATGIHDIEVELAEGIVDLHASGEVIAQVGNGDIRATLAPESTARLNVAVGDVDATLSGEGWEVTTQAAIDRSAPFWPGEGATGSLSVLAPTGRATVRRLASPES